MHTLFFFPFKKTKQMQSSSSSSLAVSTTRRFSRGKSSPPLPSALRSSEATSPQSPTVRGRSRSSLSKEHSSEEEQQRDRGSTRERATTGAQPEEYVTFTSSDETALVHEGWLWKTDPYGKHWKKRYGDDLFGYTCPWWLISIWYADMLWLMRPRGHCVIMDRIRQ